MSANASRRNAKLRCAEDGSDVPIAALRALFAAAVQRAVVAKERRDKLEDRCNGVAAENQALASELAKRRAEAGRAQVRHKFTREKNSSSKKTAVSAVPSCSRQFSFENALVLKVVYTCSNHPANFTEQSAGIVGDAVCCIRCSCTLPVCTLLRTVVNALTAGLFVWSLLRADSDPLHPNLSGETIDHRDTAQQ